MSVVAMGKPRIETNTEDRAAAPRELGFLVRAALVICGALLLVLCLDRAGLVDAIDDGLRSGWVRLADEFKVARPTNYGVILVAADAETIEDEDWGPPPWSADKLATLLEQIDDGKPVLVAEVGHRPMFVPSVGLDEAIDGVDFEVVMQRHDEERRSPWTSAGLEHGDIVLGEDSRIHAVTRAAELPPIGDRLPVNYLLPASRLPVVPAKHVADNTIPASSFDQRIVLMGVTDSHHEMLIDTPLGRLSPAEIEAHALAGLRDDAVWSEFPVWAAYLSCALFSVFLLWSFARLSGGQAVVIIFAGAVLVLVLDFAAYQRAFMRLGSARLLLCVFAVGLSYWLHEALDTIVGLRQLQARVLRDAAGDGGIDESQGFWDDLAQLGAAYARETLGAAVGSTIIERPGEGWKLEVRASEELDEDSAAALQSRANLDLRRAPFRTPWLTLRAGWAADLLPRAARYGKRKSLLVPLEDQGELLGLWLVHVDESLEVGPEDVETFEKLGRQMAGTLVRRRERQALREQGKAIRLRDYVESIVGGLRMLRDQQRWALELLEQLPVRALISTVWGEIEFIDPRLKSELERRYPGLFSPDRPDDNLRVILARLTGQSMEEVNRLMRKVLAAENVEIELEVKPGIEDPGDDVWILSRIRSKRGIDLPGFKPAVHEHILLMARSSAPAKTIRTRSGGLLRVLRGGFGEP